MQDAFNIKEFSIIDDSFTSIPKRAIKFCQLMRENNIDIPWSLPTGIRVDTVSEELLGNMRDAGCYRVGFGIESGNPYIMQTIKKRITLEQASNVVSLAKKLGLECSGYFIIGNFEETLSTIDDTIKFALKVNPDYAQFTRATPYPGSEMYRTLVEENNIISHNWDDYDPILIKKEIFKHKNLSLEQIQKKIKEA